MLNQPVPDFELPSTGGTIFRLSDYRGKNLVIYFYPKDSTPGCTTEGQDFSRLHPEFLRAGTLVFGISRDSIKSHESFKIRQNFPFELLCDAKEKACTIFGVIKMKSMYGKAVRGIERSTFVIGSTGIMLREWRGIKVSGHAQEILDFVNTL